jgi:drug/metabolite transporter (DMT)-like permease
MLAILFALGASVSWGTADFFGGLTTRRLPLLTVVTLSQLFALLTGVALVAGRWQGPADTRVLVLGSIAGLLGTAGIAVLYQALALGPMGVVAPIAALSGLVPAVWGLLHGDRPSVVAYIGMGLAISGVVFAARHREIGGAKISRRGAILAVSAAVLLGVTVTLLAEAGTSDPAWAVLMLRAASVVPITIALILVRPSLRVRRPDLGILAVMGVCDSGANMLFILANQHGLLSLVAVLGSLYPVATVLLARGVLKERLSPVQIVGVSAAFVGVAMIALG